MSDAKEAKFSMKVLINKQKTKVLFAEVNRDFADVLLSFLTLPLGTVLRVLEKHYGEKAPLLGSLNTLYNGLSNLNSVHFWTEGGKQMLLHPRSSFEAECRKLKLDVSDTHPTKYFTCEDSSCKFPKYENASMFHDSARCTCGKSLKREFGIESQAADGDAEGFTIKTTFLVCDDLRIAPNVAVSIMHTLSYLGITDADGAELMSVTFGFNEIMDLLKGSLLSRTPLTDIILSRKQMASATQRIEPVSLLHQNGKHQSASHDSKKMILKLMVQESTNKLLFAQAEDDFVDFLFSLLTIPLGGVECLLGGNTGFKSIDNLYRSITDVIDDKYLRTPDTKNKLMKPKIAHGYISKNQILPLKEEDAPVLYYHREESSGKEWVAPSYKLENGVTIGRFRYRKGQESYVKGPTMYMVTDDLTVTPLCMTTTLSALNDLKIPLSDVKEMKIQIGLEEALSILKASLTSTCALTNALMIDPTLKK